MRKWNDFCFLLEMKPQSSGSAGLFINCPIRSEEQKVKVFKSEIQISSLEQPELLRATVEKIQIRPDTVSKCSWADATTFTCNICVDTYDSDMDISNTTELIDWLQSGFKLRHFCELLNSTSGGGKWAMECAACKNSILTEQHTLKRAFPLPSSNWEETSSDWFCHSHNHGGNDDHSGHKNPMKPTAEQVLVGEVYFLVNSVCLCRVTREEVTNIIRCGRCKADLGRIHSSRRMSDLVISDTPNSTFQLFHSAVKLSVKGSPADDQVSIKSAVNNVSAASSVDPLADGYLISRFGSMQRFYSWLVLSESESQSSLKFVVKTLDDQPILLIWLLDSYSIFTSGVLREKGSEEDVAKENAADAEDSIVASVPFPVLKILYKVIDETNRGDPRVMGMDYSVGKIFLPDSDCHQLAELLLTNSHSLPTPCRNVGQFYVGFLQLADSI